MSKKSYAGAIIETLVIYAILVALVTLVAWMIVPDAEAHVADLRTPACYKGCPIGPRYDSNITIAREVYTLSYNPDRKMSDWVAYAVTPRTIGQSKERTWAADPLLEETEALEPDDYDGAHRELKTDRGHFAPLASFSGTPHWDTTNYLSNISPQRSTLNQGVWKQIETVVRYIAKRYHTTVYVVTGPLFEQPEAALPEADEYHMVPSGYWKVIATVVDGELQVAAFITPQDLPRKAYLCKYKVPLEEVVARTGLHFFPHHSAPAGPLKVSSCA